MYHSLLEFNETHRNFLLVVNGALPPNPVHYCNAVGILDMYSGKRNHRLSLSSHYSTLLRSERIALVECQKSQALAQLMTLANQPNQILHMKRNGILRVNQIEKQASLVLE